MHRNETGRVAASLRVMAVLIACLAARQAVAFTLYRPGQTLRTLNTDLYDIDIQKNGRFNVSLASGVSVFAGARPMIWLEGKNAPEAMPLAGDASARIEVKDSLGQGQGMALQKGDCLWVIRVYPGKPFFTVQASYLNTSSAAVRIRMLIPWSIGEGLSKGICSLGEGGEDAVSLINAAADSPWEATPEFVAGGSTSLWSSVTYNADNGRVLIAGFLTNERALTQIRLERSAKAPESAYDVFEARCLYDPPVEVPAGGRLDSELLYVAAAESNPYEGMERFAHAMGVVQGWTASRPAPSRGWSSACGEGSIAPTEDLLLAQADMLDSRLRPYGWNYFEVGKGWQKAPDVFEPAVDRFPSGMKSLAAGLRQRGLRSGLYIDPFLVSETSDLARSHPEWLAAISAKSSVAGMRLLDPTDPEVGEYLAGLGRRVGQEWNFDVAVLGPSLRYVMCAESYRENGKTRVEALRRAIQALQGGMGDGKQIIASGPPYLVGGKTFAVDSDSRCASPGEMDAALERALRRYYLAPFMGAPRFAYLPPAGSAMGKEGTLERPDLARDQTIARLTAAAMLGGAIQLAGPVTALSQEDLDILQRLTPVPDRPARPMGLFDGAMPRVWALPYDTPAGKWLILGLFNWDAARLDAVTLDLAALGLSPDAYYVVYDFWKGEYLGKARQKLNVEIRPGAVKVLGFRKYDDRPMFVASNRHFTQGAMDHTALLWDEQARILRGSFRAIPDTDYVLTVLCPPGYRPASLRVSAGLPAMTLEGQTLRIQFRSDVAGPAEWSVQF